MEVAGVVEQRCEEHVELVHILRLDRAQRLRKAWRSTGDDISVEQPPWRVLNRHLLQKAAASRTAVVAPGTRP